MRSEVSHCLFPRARELQVAYNLGRAVPPRDHRRRRDHRDRRFLRIADDQARTSAIYDAQYGLPAPPSFTMIQPARPGPALQEELRLRGLGRWKPRWMWSASHAMAPGANILLVETPVSETEGVTGFPQIVRAENYVIDHDLGDVISQSFGATEETFPNARRRSWRCAARTAERGCRIM